VAAVPWNEPAGGWATTVVGDFGRLRLQLIEKIMKIKILTFLTFLIFPHRPIFGW